ncbi:MAG: helix-turn-helix domain-containing protein [Elusimicrobiales bacterium]|nr:helix-turn-helix domain-containing protein [Elusimicrobiales bacterium]
MPQIQLPIFPEGTTNITNEIGFIKEGGRIIYLNGHLPVFMHDEKDIQTFRMITSQFIVTGLVRQVDIVRAFGVPVRTVKRYVKLYREKGVKGFYEARRRRGASVLIPEVLIKVQEMLDAGKNIGEVSKQFGIKRDTLNKAIYSGKIHYVKKKKNIRKKN